MKHFLTLALCCSLLMLGTAFADQQDPNHKNKGGQKPPPTKTNVQHTQTNVHNTGVHPNNSQLHTTPTHTNTTLHNTGNVHTTGNVHNNTHVNTTTNNIHNKTVNKSVTKNNFQPQHQNFHAVQNGKVQSVKFNQHYVIPGSHNWHGHQYAVFQNYHPAWHDHGWYHNHYHNVVLIGGGWYFWNAGYWFPAWGYDPGVAYYPYDGPIYVGSNPTPPDQVIADVQSNLQQQGYYQGEVDGLLGPQTRAALADYQQAQGLEVTAAMDEPTLASLGMS